MKDGVYNLSVKHIGYRPAIRDSIDVSSGKGLVVNFALLLENTLLKGVTVSAIKSPITSKADRIIINVAANPLAAGGQRFGSNFPSAGRHQPGLHFAGAKQNSRSFDLWLIYELKRR